MDLTIEHVEDLHIHIGADTPNQLAQATLRGFGPLRADPPAPAASTLTPPALGTLWPGQGGYYGGTMPARGGKPAYHLIWSVDQADSLQYGGYDHETPRAGDHHDGSANTAALVADTKDHPAAQWASKVTADGHKDFFLPAHAQLMFAYIMTPELFEKQGWYWSSTQFSRNLAWIQDFESGYSHGSVKGGHCRAVALRTIPLL